jgi:transcriptional regulator with XRE-family HTH domain
VISPYARRTRLANCLRRLRDEAGLSGTQLAVKAGVDRTMVSKLETGDRRPNLNTVLKLLDALPVAETDGRYRTIVRIARDAAERGWWETTEYAGMGERQARTADLECGAVSIREYQPSMLPGLVQTADFAHHRGLIALADGATFDPEATVRARMRRQQQLDQPDNCAYDLVLDEPAVRRVVVPVAVMADQLRHLLILAGRPNVSVRVLPVDARLVDGRVPRSPFAIYAYPDEDDPTIVAADTVTTDLIMADPAESERYELMFDRLRRAALSERDSIALIKRTAEQLSTEV